MNPGTSERSRRHFHVNARDAVVPGAQEGHDGVGEADGVGVAVAVCSGEGDGDSEGVGVGVGVRVGLGDGVGVGVGVGVGNSTSDGGWKGCTGMPVVATVMNRCQMSAGIEPPYTTGNPPMFRMEMLPRG